jgi:putative ABC transport system permease protein
MRSRPSGPRRPVTRLTVEESSMFFITYLRRELRRRMHQAIFVALGLAVGIGLVVTVSAASAGVKKAEAGVLSALYGVGTDVTVTGPAPAPSGHASTPAPRNATSIQPGPRGTDICRNGRCENAAGHTIQILDPQYSPVPSADVAAVARLHDVPAAAGGLLLTDTTTTFPQNYGQPGSALPSSSFFSVDGVDTARLALSPLSAGTITSGHSLTAADAGSDAAVLDSGYATSHNLTAGSALTIDNVRFTVIGTVRQPQTGSTPDDIYIPLARAQALELGDGSAETGEVNMIYVTAASAADIPAVQHEIAALFPHATVTTAASLASEVTSSVASAASLASDLGKWLAVLVLIAAFAVASLLTMSAVARRAAEFGTLKALGWRTRRVIAQVLGESLAIGIAAAAAGTGLGFAGAAIITAVAPRISATVPGSSAAFSQAAGQAAGPGGGVAPAADPATAPHVVAVPLHPSITAGVIVLAVLLAVAGGLLAGAFGSWQIARLRPADALTQVA